MAQESIPSNFQQSIATGWYRSVAIIYRDNRPVLVRSLLNSGRTVCGSQAGQTSLNQIDLNQLNWTIFTSLDGIDHAMRNIDSDPSRTKPSNAKAKAASTSVSNFLGVIQASDTHKILGYVTATRVKFMLILDSSKPLPRDVDIRRFFEQLHALWSRLCGSPFYRLGDMVSQPNFAKKVDQLLIKL